MTIWLGSEAAAAMIASAKRFSPLETGGVLLGWRDGEDRIVVDVVGPGPRSLHGRHMFVPDHAWQVDQINQIFEQTDGDLDYLGDWHTHPDGVAAMSNEDEATLRRIAKKVANPIMVIAANDDAGSWSFGGWLQPRPKLLTRVPADEQAIRVFNVPVGWPRAVHCRGVPDMERA